jgi:drug/metabolite transporter (DMT)-like permease
MAARRMHWLERVSGKGLFTVIVWGASFVATRLALDAFSPFGLVAVRLWLGTLLLATVQLAGGRQMWPERRDWGVGVFLGTVLSVHLFLQACGLLHTSAMNTGWIIGFIPVCIALGSTLVGQQRLAAVGWLGVAVGTGGVLAVAAKSPPNFAQATRGDLLQIASCVTWTIYTLAASRPVARNGALRMTTFGMAVAAVIATALAGAQGLRSGALTWTAGGAVAFLGLISSGAAYYCWFAAQHEHGPARLGALLYVEPFVTLIVAALVLHEPITANAIGGGVLVLVGVWLVARGAPRPVVEAAGAE